MPAAPRAKPNTAEDTANNPFFAAPSLPSVEDTANNPFFAAASVAKTPNRDVIHGVQIMTTFSCVFRFEPISGDEVCSSLDCHPDIRALKRRRMQWHLFFLHPTSLVGCF
jgi:hypothetical protein